MKVTVRKISALMIVVFAMFVCGNTLFIHSHTLNGHKVTHSHPYLPGEAHQHSATAFQYLAGTNAAAYSMVASATINVNATGFRCIGRINSLPEKAFKVSENDCSLTRGPPMLSRA